MAETSSPEPMTTELTELPDTGCQARGVLTAGEEISGLAAMLDVPLRLTVELGRADLPLAEVLGLRPGCVVELDRFPGEPLDLYANGRLIARGEIIVLNDIFGFRITDVLMARNEPANP
jgi:flagellar motor switch protein FliN/FliY